jgi:hypothetical protein
MLFSCALKIKALKTMVLFTYIATLDFLPVKIKSINFWFFDKTG